MSQAKKKNNNTKLHIYRSAGKRPLLNDSSGKIQVLRSMDVLFSLWINFGAVGG